MIDDCTALILAGGESRRMGQDKACLRLGDQTLLQSVIAALEPLFSEIIVSVRRMRAECELSQVCDDPLHAGPLAGLAAGLAHARTDWVFVVACDMPFITGELVGHLAAFRAGVDAVVPVVEGYPQPLAAFYATRTLNPLREILCGGGKQSFRALLDKLDVRYVDESEIQAADLRSFFDLDTPEDLSIAANMSGEPDARRIK